MLYVYKSMFNKIKNEWRSPAIFILLISMLISLFLSRALLSATVGAFFLLSFFHDSPPKQLRLFINSPLLWGLGLLFVLPFITGIWSEDKNQWLDVLRIKLPLLLLPLAFAAPFNLSKKQWDYLAYIFILLLLSASIWSMIIYLNDMKAVHESYLRAKTMITPLENDHVRFSWLYAVGIMVAAYMVRGKKMRSPTAILLFICAGWFIIFLHILSARTGLACFYLLILAAGIALIIKNRNWKLGIGMFGLIILLPLAAYLLFPSFQNRVKYSRYEFDYFKKASYTPGANDVMRVISIKAGWNIMNENPVTGSGFGDLMPVMKQEYEKLYPEMLESDKILPGSEMVVYGAAAGWTGFVLFGVVMVIPFLCRSSFPFFWTMICLMNLFSLLVDIALEVQFGVFINSFILLWFWKWWVNEKI